MQYCIIEDEVAVCSRLQCVTPSINQYVLAFRGRSYYIVLATAAVVGPIRTCSLLLFVLCLTFRGLGNIPLFYASIKTLSCPGSYVINVIPSARTTHSGALLDDVAGAGEPDSDSDLRGLLISHFRGVLGPMSFYTLTLDMFSRYSQDLRRGCNFSFAFPHVPAAYCI
jgi:hypothetical protein